MYDTRSQNTLQCCVCYKLKYFFSWLFGYFKGKVFTLWFGLLPHPKTTFSLNLVCSASVGSLISPWAFIFNPKTKMMVVLNSVIARVFLLFLYQCLCIFNQHKRNKCNKFIITAWFNLSFSPYSETSLILSGWSFLQLPISVCFIQL